MIEKMKEIIKAVEERFSEIQEETLRKFLEKKKDIGGLFFSKNESLELSRDRETEPKEALLSLEKKNLNSCCFHLIVTFEPTPRPVPRPTEEIRANTRCVFQKHPKEASDEETFAYCVETNGLVFFLKTYFWLNHFRFFKKT